MKNMRTQVDQPVKGRSVMRECSPKKGMTKGHLLAIKPWVFFFFKSSFYRSGQQNDMINKIEYFYKCKCHLQ